MGSDLFVESWGTGTPVVLVHNQALLALWRTVSAPPSSRASAGAD